MQRLVEGGHDGRRCVHEEVLLGGSALHTHDAQPLDHSYCVRTSTMACSGAVAQPSTRSVSRGFGPEGKPLRGGASTMARRVLGAGRGCWLAGRTGWGTRHSSFIRLRGRRREGEGRRRGRRHSTGRGWWHGPGGSARRRSDPSSSPGSRGQALPQAVVSKSPQLQANALEITGPCQIRPGRDGALCRAGGGETSASRTLQRRTGRKLGGDGT